VKDRTSKSGQGSIFIPGWIRKSEWSVLVDSIDAGNCSRSQEVDAYGRV
jgi:hypothetical protein